MKRSPFCTFRNILLTSLSLLAFLVSPTLAQNSITYSEVFGDETQLTKGENYLLTDLNNDSKQDIVGVFKNNDDENGLFYHRLSQSGNEEVRLELNLGDEFVDLVTNIVVGNFDINTNEKEIAFLNYDTNRDVQLVILDWNGNIINTIDLIVKFNLENYRLQVIPGSEQDTILVQGNNQEFEVPYVDYFFITSEGIQDTWQIFLQGYLPHKPIVGDFDNDGNLEIFIEMFDKIEEDDSYNFYYVLADNGGSDFYTYYDINFSGSYGGDVSYAAGDVDNDGRTDLVVGKKLKDNSYRIEILNIDQYGVQIKSGFEIGTAVDDDTLLDTKLSLGDVDEDSDLEIFISGISAVYEYTGEINAFNPISSNHPYLFLQNNKNQIVNEGIDYGAFIFSWADYECNLDFKTTTSNTIGKIEFDEENFSECYVSRVEIQEIDKNSVLVGVSYVPNYGLGSRYRVFRVDNMFEIQTEGSWTNKYADDCSSSNLDLDCEENEHAEVTPTPTPTPTPVETYTHYTNVCTVLTQNGNVVNADSNLGDFEFSGNIYENSTWHNYAGENPKEYVINQDNFALNADVLGDDGINDAFCQLVGFNNGKGTYYRFDEVEGEANSIKYNDGFKFNKTMELEDLKEYSGELFDEDRSNDRERVTVADGHMYFGKDEMTRNLVIGIDLEVVEPTPTPSPTLTPSPSPSPTPSPTPEPYEDSWIAFKIIDIDNDGEDEYVGISKYSRKGIKYRFEILDQSLQLVYQSEEYTSFSKPEKTWEIESANVDSDPYYEIIFVTAGNLVILDHELNIQNLFSIDSTYRHGGRNFAYTDLNKDGIKDVLTNVYTSPYKKEDLFGFDAEANKIIWTNSYSEGYVNNLFEFDFNGDGLIEILSIKKNRDKVSTIFTLYDLNGNVLKVDEVSDEYRYFRVGDMNSDGRNEIYFQRYSGRPKTIKKIEYSNDLDMAISNFANTYNDSIPLHSGFNRLTFGDIDLDGNEELISSMFSSNGKIIRVFDNTGKELSSIEVNANNGINPVVIDTNFDGVAEIYTLSKDCYLVEINGVSITKHRIYPHRTFCPQNGFAIHKTRSNSFRIAVLDNYEEFDIIDFSEL